MLLVTGHCGLSTLDVKCIMIRRATKWAVSSSHRLTVLINSRPFTSSFAPVI